MSIGGKVISSLRWMAVARFSGQVLSWVVTIFVIRILTPDDYGLMAMAMVAITLLALLNEMGMGSVLVQQQELDHRTVECIFGLLILINGALYTSLYLGAPLIAVFFEEPRLVEILRVIALQFIFMPFSVVANSMLSRRMDFRRMSFVDMWKIIAASITTLTLALNGYGIWALVFGNLLGALVDAVGATLAAKCWYRPRFRFSGMKQMIGFGGYVMASRILFFIYVRADIFIIGKLLGKDLLGLYSVAKDLASLPMEKVSGVLNMVGFSAFSRIQDDRDEVREKLLKAVRILSFFAFPMFAGISSISPEIVEVILGEKWLAAIVPLQLLSLIIPLRMVQNIIPPVLMSIGRPEVAVSNLVIACIIMAVSFLIGVQWGINGVSQAWLFGYPVFFVIMLKRSLPILGLTIAEYLKSMYGPAMVAGVMYFAVIVVRQTVTQSMFSGPVDLAVLVGTGALIYGTLMLLTQRQACNEMLILFRR